MHRIACIFALKVGFLPFQNMTKLASEEKIRGTSEPQGRVERIKKIKGYAFVHLEDCKVGFFDLNCLK